MRDTINSNNRDISPMESTDVETPDVANQHPGAYRLYPNGDVEYANRYSASEHEDHTNKQESDEDLSARTTTLLQEELENNRNHGNGDNVLSSWTIRHIKNELDKRIKDKTIMHKTDLECKDKTSKPEAESNKEGSVPLRMAAPIAKPMADPIRCNSLQAPQPPQDHEGFVHSRLRTNLTYNQEPRTSVPGAVNVTGTPSVNEADVEQSVDVVAHEATTVEDYENGLIGRMQGQLEGVLEQQVQQELSRRINSVAVAEPMKKQDESPMICGVTKLMFLMLLLVIFIILVIIIVSVVAITFKKRPNENSRSENSPIVPIVGTCGDGLIGNGICADGTCCSTFGYCGIEHCSNGDNNTTLGTCGNGFRGNGVCLDNRFCCSPFGYCGLSDEHCTNPDGSPLSGNCGNGFVGNGICANKKCCSENGWCGTTPDHCYGGGDSQEDNQENSETLNFPCGDGYIGNGTCVDGSCCSIHGWCGTTDAHCNGDGASLEDGNSTNVNCGNGNVGNGICADGSCCSMHGWCGTTDEHCTGDGDIASPEDGISTNMDGDGASREDGNSTDVNCGNGDIGNGICVDGSCCSVHGWCGMTDEHCNGDGDVTVSPKDGNATNVNCGNGIIGNGICTDGSCCSVNGWCGTTDAHCSK